MGFQAAFGWQNRQPESGVRLIGAARCSMARRMVRTALMRLLLVNEIVCFRLPNFLLDSPKGSLKLFHQILQRQAYAFAHVHIGGNAFNGGAGFAFVVAQRQQRADDVFAGIGGSGGE